MMDSIRRLFGYSMPRLGGRASRTYFRFTPKYAVKELFPGVKVQMNFHDESCRATWWNGFRYEKPLPTLLRHLCADAEMFFDIGANFGFYSYLVLSYCPSVKVFSFEPNPGNFAVLADAKARNGLVNSFPFNIGLSDETGELDLTVDLISTGHSVFGPEHPDFNGDASVLETHRVQVRRFDDWMAEQSTPTTMRAVAKIDIEGFELRALRGMESALRDRVFKALVVEIMAKTLRLCDNTPLEVGDYLARFGYFPFDLELRPTTIRADDARNLVFLPTGASSPAA
jgi:FkbM family methyltransferase